MKLPYVLRRPLRVAQLVVATVAPSPGGLAGQQARDAVLQGQVVDSMSGAPVGDVLVRLDSGAETLTGPDGRFRVAGLEAGVHLVAILTADCRIDWSEVDLAAGAVREARFALAPGLRAVREDREQAERRRAQGKLVTSDEIRAMNARSLADVLRRVAPNMVGSASMAGAATPVRGRSRNSFVPGGDEPVLVVDGVRAPDVARALDAIDPSDVASLEVLAGSAAGWEFGSSGAGGVIRVTTHLGRTQSQPPDARVQPCVAAFPGG